MVEVVKALLEQTTLKPALQCLTQPDREDDDDAPQAEGADRLADFGTARMHIIDHICPIVESV